MDAWKAENFCYITTTGRRTDKPHTIEIWFGVNEGRLYVLSGSPRSDWLKNLQANPRVLIHVGGESDRPARAMVVIDPEEDAMARRLLAAKYQGWREGKPLSQWASTALPVRFELAPS
jgi:deazaflavin-dependent oxidoreductase (nitroreductase family)